MFPEDVQHDLQRYSLLELARQFVKQHARTGIALRSHRVSDRPLRPGLINRFLGKSGARPVLDATDSKFGGSPYHHGEGLEEDHQFIGQINFEQVSGAIDAGLPDRGILTIWAPHHMAEFPLVTRWYPEPTGAVPVSAEPFGKWETEIRFDPITVYPAGDRWMAFLEDKQPDAELEEIWFDAQEHVGAGRDSHQLGGWPHAGLYDHYGFEAPPGKTDAIDEWEMLLSLDFDNEAGFSWGSNYVYFLVDPTSLAAADLGEVIVTAANY